MADSGAQLNRLLPEVQSHEVLAFVAKFLIAAIEDNNVNYVGMFALFAPR